MRCFMNCEPNDGDDEKFYIAVFAELTIYGHTVDAWTKINYPEDWVHTVNLRKDGLEFGCWHSVACPDGEIGSNDPRILREITREQFVEASENGWPQDQWGLTAPGPISAIYTADEDGVKKVWDSLRGDVA